jgi:TolA-binding protein
VAMLRVLLLFGCFLPAALFAQQPGMTRALDLERRGDYAAAAQAYRTILGARPADVSALLGLERSLLPLNRSREILPFIRAALSSAPTSAGVYGVALRAWAAAGQPDSVRRVAEQWSRVAPTDETPYREWGAAELGRQNRAGARTAYLQGREKLGRPEALAAELAQLALADGDYAAALEEWLHAIDQLPGYRAVAVSSLGQAPERIRPQLLEQLANKSGISARRLEAELRARWGDPLGALQILTPVLPADRMQAIVALRALLEQVRPLPTPEGKLAQGRILEALADRYPSSQASRLRLEAAQAYSEAGDKDAARRMLSVLTTDRAAPASVSAGAAATLVDVLINEGKLEDADKRLSELRATLPAEEYDDLRRRLASAWIRTGDLARAEATIAPDSSVEGLALNGRIRLYRGDIRGAVDRFKAAGPYTGDRQEATRRTTLLALLQPIEADSSPALGHALLLLEQGDTTEAAVALEQLAPEFPVKRGGAELHLLVGRLYAATARPAEAERLFRAAADRNAPATAAAAELALGELLLSSGRAGEAVSVLEHLILTYPQSALVPQARRKLDEARGAIPKT